MPGYTQREMADMLEVLQSYAIRDTHEHAELSAIEEAMAHLLAPLPTMTQELKVLLRCHEKLAHIAWFQQRIQEECERAYKYPLPFEGSMAFATEQIMPQQTPPWAGPTLRADTWEEAETRAALLGLKIVGKL